MRKQSSYYLAAFILLALVLVACSSPDRTTPDKMTSDRSQALHAPASRTSETGFVYTANERGNSISVIDLSTGQVKDIATRITPHNVQVSRDGRRLLAVGPVAAMTGNQSQMKMNDDGETPRGRLLILDAETLAVASATDIEIGRHPAHVIIDAQGKLAYATNSEDNNVLVIDVEQKKSVGEFKTGKFPHGLRISPDGREIYVANVKDDSVSVIDIAQSKEVAQIPVGKAPVQVQVIHYNPREDMVDGSAALVFKVGKRFYPVMEVLAEAMRGDRPIVNALFGLKVRVNEGLLLGFAFQVPTTSRKDFSSQMVFQPDIEWGRRR